MAATRGGVHFVEGPECQAEAFVGVLRAPGGGPDHQCHDNHVASPSDKEVRQWGGLGGGGSRWTHPWKPYQTLKGFCIPSSSYGQPTSTGPIEEIRGALGK